MKPRLPIWPLVLLSALLLAGFAPRAHAQQRLTIQPESRLWIEGTSTLDTFTCRSEAVQGSGTLKAGPPEATPAATPSAAPSAATPSAATPWPPQAEVHVRVETFDCGKRIMTRDLYQALKAATYPQIRFTLRDAEVLARSAEAKAAIRLRLAGWLTVAGTTRLVETTAYAQRLEDERYRLWGSQPLRMSDFGIEPPTGLLGLVRAHDRIRVRFDLVASPLFRAQATHSTP